VKKAARTPARSRKLPTSPTPKLALALANLALIVFDFDGVMTDNRVLVMQDGTEGVLCNRSDGLGVGMLKDAGLAMLVLSKEQNPVVAARCKKLKVECIQGIDDKLARLTAILAERNLDASNVAYVGNDLNDVECMSNVGVPIAVADAYPQVLKVARLATTRNGGHGAVREVCDWILRARASAAD
jgi:YrbI family 3-deoxy-D-manno-octulosonate 8-phosphate phosphatase